MSEISESTRTRELPGPIGNPGFRWLYQTWTMARLTVRNLAMTKRTIAVILLACVPVGLALIIKHVAPEQEIRPASQEIFTGLFVGLYVYFVVLLTTIVYGISLIADERSDRTIIFLLVRPLPREAIVVGKFLAYALSASAILLASLIATYSIFSSLDQDPTSFRNAVPFSRCAEVVVLAVLAYGAVFTFFGATFKHPVITAFGYCFVWESILPYLPVFLKKLTLMHYIHSLIPNWGSQGGVLAFAVEPTPPDQAVKTLIGICLAFLVLAVVSLRLKEHTFEKEKEL